MKSFLRVFSIGILTLLLGNPLWAAEKDFGTKLIIETKPAGAKIQLDYRNIGTTPHTLENIKPGRHFLTLIMYGYHRIEKHITVKAGQEKKVYELLMALVGVLSVKTKPPGASVMLNDSIFLGQTPFYKPNVVIGQHTIKISLHGYKTFVKDFKLKYGEEKKFVLTLPPQPGILAVSTVPSGATVYIDGKRKGRSRASIELLGGSYKIEIKKADYRTETHQVTVNPGQTTHLDLTLEDFFQTKLSVKTKPPDAYVFLDGENIGKTPRLVKKVEPGVHTLGLNKKGYQDVDKKIFIKKNETTKIFEVLKLQVGSLSISVTPPDAKIYLDNKYLGASPRSMDNISAGSHTLRIRDSKYKEYIENFVLASDEYKTVEITLQPLPGKLDLAADKEGAAVYIDGIMKGMSPLVALLQPGSHKLSVQTEGYLKYQEEITIEPGETLKVYALLKKIRSGAIKITTVPPGAQVIIDAKPMGKTPATVSALEVGEHEVDLRMLGYKTTTATVDVRDGETVELELELEAKSGTLQLTTVPSGARVKIDKATVGYTPLKADVPAGSHILEVSKENYQIWETSFIIDYQEEKEIRHTLEPIPGMVVVISHPSGSDLAINGDPRGQTPKSVALTPGRYVIRVSREGYHPEEKVVRIGLNEKEEISFDLEEILQGALLVSTVPPGAKIYLNGERKGESPANYSELRTGKYLVKITKEGFKSIEKLITIYKNKSAEILEELAPQTGSLYVKIFPPDAGIHLDDKYLGSSPQLVRNLLIGEHEIKITHEDYADWIEEFVIEPDRQNRININLRNLPGEVYVFSSPSEGDIYVDKQYKGKTNSLIKLSPGNYKITVKKPGFYDYYKDVTVPSGRQISLDYHLLEQGTGNILVTSSPPGAQVFINGDFVGQTPLEKKYLKAASHSLLIIKDGYKSITDNFTLTKGESFELNLTLSSVWGTLKIFTEPENAHIYMDGEFLGKGSGVFEKIRVGRHRIKATHKNFRDWVGDFNLKPDEEKTIRIEMDALPARISINSTPDKASVYIEGEHAGYTPLSLPLAPGPSSIRLEKEGYLAKNISMEILPGMDETFQAILIRKKILRVAQAQPSAQEESAAAVKKKTCRISSEPPLFPSIPQQARGVLYWYEPSRPAPKFILNMSC